MPTDLSSSSTQERVRRLGRVGYVTYGLVQIALGYLALQLAFGQAPQDASTSGALSALAQPGPGRTLVWLVAVGMAVLAGWQAIVAVTEHDGARGRLAAAGKVVVYLVVAGLAVRVASGGGGSSGDSGEQAAATLLDLPGGVLLVGAVGVGFVLVAGYLVYNGATTGFRDDLEGAVTDGSSGTGVLWLGRVGYVTKGVALGVIGLLFLTAAATHDADKAGGLDDALQTLKEQPFGPYVLAAVATGFVAFGLYCFVRAGYERD